MASTSKAETKPVRGILKTSKSDHQELQQPDAKKKARKLPAWMQKSSSIKAKIPPPSALKIPSSCNIIYSHNENDSISICNNILEGVRETRYLGFDIEWPVTYSSSNEAKTAVIQICDDPTKRCFVFHISCFGHLPVPLKSIIESDDIIKVGLNIEGDLYKLCRDFDVRFPNQGFLELSDYANEVTKSSERWSLARLVRFLFGCEMPKTDNIRKGDWTMYPLSAAQLEYAALDAIASLMIFHELQQRENGSKK